MLCQKCGNHTATTHIRRSINGASEEMMLCDRCAAELGYHELSFLTGGLLGNLFRTDLSGHTADAALRCSGCGISFEEVLQTGRVGCARCYREFADRLTPTIEKIHGRTGHKGKRPAAKAEKATDTRSEIENWREELQTAITEQEFEKAAELRDKIKAWEEAHHE